MSAYSLMRAAAADVVRLRNHLVRAREYARVLGADERLLQEIQSAYALEASLRTLGEQLGTVEARRRISTRREGRAA